MRCGPVDGSATARKMLLDGSPTARPLPHPGPRHPQAALPRNGSRLSTCARVLLSDALHRSLAVWLLANAAGGHREALGGAVARRGGRLAVMRGR